MRLGLERFLASGYEAFQDKRIGLVTNLTGVNQDLVPAIDLFANHQGINLVALFAPEHGIRGDAKEGEKVESSKDTQTGLPVFSLYGKSKKPSARMLADVDVVVFDLQDLGSRYYTFIYTMAYMMEACQQYEKHFIVLDRPNPIGGEKIEGNLVEEDVRSFVGLLPIPNRHGLTVGELALLFKYEFGYDCDLTVIEMEDWERSDYFDDTSLFWVPPSPNAPTLDMAILYPGTCLLEGTNVSEGRGTAKPFEYVGAPFIDGYQLAKEFNSIGLAGVLARPTSFVPTYQKFEGQVCSGIQLHVTSRQDFHSFETGVKLLETINKLYPNDFHFVQHPNGRYMFDLLIGTKSMQQMILQGTTETFLAQAKEQSTQFKKQTTKYRLYH
ncbi:exo-beta-N-acetylmuramidase NamZ domain-containing protein [Alkalihalobacillus pseudalcaliphilus]|uniref:exo-beta-N-acetylmuramidase NamZ family protein n=1 Tax=Alkalihalobacillus pseudalcaliphilus TaxID=79884 RepID=UPI00064DB419|nr:DUF1343 domain-containing protein [Alkalihalobacillus pseudalcaliphilus]KMK75094.1 hypothetical protein AB990_16710 [Alkalihalobacillus pseudalcaliphilus]